MRVVIEKSDLVLTESDLPTNVGWIRSESGWETYVETLDELWTVLRSPTLERLPRTHTWKLFAGGVDRHGSGTPTLYLRALT